MRRNSMTSFAQSFRPKNLALPLSLKKRIAFRIFCCVMLLTAMLITSTERASACPFCSAPQLTLAEQISQTDAAVIAEWVSGVKPDFDAGQAGTTTYRIEQVIKSPSSSELKVGQEVTLPEYYQGKPETFVLLVGTLEGRLTWNSPFEITKPSFDYILKAPGPENEPATRLKYYLKHLESADPLVADDAYAEFANSPYQVIQSIRSEFPLENLRKWVFDPQTPGTRLGLYGLMMGLCGDQNDAENMRKIIINNDKDFRLGIDGVMGGYLLLAGDDGLTALIDSKLKPALQKPNPVPFSETFAAMQAIKFMWEYNPDRIPAERLRASLRTLLDHPDLADLVIIDLARWEDWSLLPRLKTMYGQEAYNIPAVKRAIVGYLIQTIKQKPTEADAAIPAHVVEAEKMLLELEESDPRTVKTARLLFR